MYIYFVSVQYSSSQIKYDLKSLLFTCAIFNGKCDTKWHLSGFVSSCVIMKTGITCVFLSNSPSAHLNEYSYFVYFWARTLRHLHELLNWMGNSSNWLNFDLQFRKKISFDVFKWPNKYENFHTNVINFLLFVLECPPPAHCWYSWNCFKKTSFCTIQHYT